MTISMYQASVPVFVRMLTNLNVILSKDAAHAQAKKIDESVLLNARLSPGHVSADQASAYCYRLRARHGCTARRPRNAGVRRQRENVRGTDGARRTDTRISAIAQA